MRPAAWAWVSCCSWNPLVVTPVCTQLITEDALLTGPLEPTNESYAIAKIGAIKLCQAYRRQYGVRFKSVMPTNLFGPNDNFDLDSAHVLLSLLRKLHLGRSTGRKQSKSGARAPRREFIDDFADALVHLMKIHESDVPINGGTGTDVTILELAKIIRRGVWADTLQQGLLTQGTHAFTS